jgi:DNA-binding transcriptional regulator WhiA
MSRNEYEIKRLLRDGISQEVSANNFDAFQLKRFVRSAVEGETTIIIRDSDQLSVFEIRRIVREGKSNVVFR